MTEATRNQPQLPSYELREHESGIILAESRAAAEHPHPVENAFGEQSSPVVDGEAVPSPTAEPSTEPLTQNGNGHQRPGTFEQPEHLLLTAGENSSTSTELTILPKQPEPAPKKTYGYTTDTRKARNARTANQAQASKVEPTPTDEPEQLWFTSAKPDLTAADAELANKPPYQKDRVNLEVAQSRYDETSTIEVLSDERRQLFAVFESDAQTDAKLHTQTVSDAVQELFAKYDDLTFKNPQDALLAMYTVFQGVPDAAHALNPKLSESDDTVEGTIVNLQQINGKMYAIIGSTDGSRAYVDSDGDDTIKRLAASDTAELDGYFFEAVEVYPDDRLIICSRDVTDNKNFMRRALDEDMPLKSANYLAQLSDRKKDHAVLAIDVDPTPEEDYVTTEDEAATQQMNVQSAATADSEPALPERRTLRKKALNMVARAAQLTGNIMSGNASFRSNQGAQNKNKRAQIMTAMGIGVAAVAAVVIGKKFHIMDELNQLGYGGGSGNTFNQVPDDVVRGSIEKASKAAASGVPTPGGGSGSGAGAAVETWKDAVRPGDGITQSFLDYAHSHGSNISPERAFQVFNDAREAGLINEDNISNISQQAVQGGFGFDGSGSTTFSHDMIEFLDKELKTK